MIPSIAPYDEAAYFQAPVETTYTVSTSVQQVAKGDGMRMLILFGVTNLSPGPSQRVQISGNQNMTASQGFNLSGLQLFNWDWYGVLVQQPWYMISNAIGGIIVTVTTLSLTRWPDPNAPKSLIQAVDDGTYSRLLSRSANGGRGRNINAVGWTQRQEASPYDLPFFSNGDLFKPKWPSGGK